MELFDINVVNLQGRSDLAPMTTPVPFGMKSSSSQILNLLQALRLGHFFLFFFALAYFKATHKKNLFGCPSIPNPNYLPLHLTTSTPPKTLNLTATQTLLL
jgi:hypothetical protein